MKRYYIDTCIWKDYFEERKGNNGEMLCEFAWKLFCMIVKTDSRVVVTDFIIAELRNNYSLEQITSMILPFEKFIDMISITKKQRDEAKKIARERNIPPGDALHAIIARDHGLILVTRDKHFKSLRDISEHYLPERLI